MSDRVKSPNFEFLKSEDELLFNYALRAERYVFDDPNSCLIKLRQLAEHMAQQVATAFRIEFNSETRQLDLLNDLYYHRIISSDISQIFHSLRKEGNLAVHDHGMSEKRQSLYQLKLAHHLASWYHKTVNDSRFKLQPFVPPPRQEDQEEQLKETLDNLTSDLIEKEQAIKLAQSSAEEQARLKLEAEQAAKQAYADLNAALEMAEESSLLLEQQKADFALQLQKMKTEANKRSNSDQESLLARSASAAAEIEKTEKTTRIFIDEQLREHGWEVDSDFIRYSKGARPQKGKNIAISEWPTASGPADYVLFCGLQPIAIVEAKREIKNISGSIVQAKRYSRDFKENDVQLAGAWGEYKVPFLFSTNGSPYHEQLKHASGTWFLDCRKSTNIPRAFDGWYTPDGLKQLFKQDVEAADKKLELEPNDLPLRDYQKDAVKSVEQAIAKGQREIMLAMATGTGKTRTCIGLVYRLVKTRRFRRVLFLVDRTSLGEQALNAFKDLQIDNLQTFADIFDIKGMGDKNVDDTTRLHITTVQGVMQRILYPSKDSLPLPVDMYDCIVVDECHRGYNLDKEMSEVELGFRSEKDYISKYRRVIEHFDAIKVGLTATPALHTTDIFGIPVYNYSYRQAVIDGYLVDHDVPFQIKTALSNAGIKYEVGETVTTYDVKKKQIDNFTTPDEVNFEIEGFNKKVINDNFNRVVCQQLVQEIDPELPGKTLIFCATDLHADTVVDILKQEFTKFYGEIDDDAVVKITGSSDKPLTLIRRYKNESLPKVAVTVDLLTTGIDVPEITNIVFIRLVRSRILYDQMLGRATRLCPDIDKESFRIFDAVDLYKYMADHSDMKPIVSAPTTTFTQLAQEMATNQDEEQLQLSRDQFVAKLQRVKKKLETMHSENFKITTGMSIDDFIKTIKNADGPQIQIMATTCIKLATWLESLQLYPGRKVIISDHEDEFIETVRGYGDSQKPEDYLESFKEYLNTNINKIDALRIIAQSPRDLTRKDLREVQLLLDQAGFSENYLRTAWKEAKQVDVAASIIGFVRAMTIGSELIPYEERLNRAMKKIMSSRQWTQPQEGWLKRIKQTLQDQRIIDQDTLNSGAFKTKGGFNRINKIFQGQLDQVLHDINEAIWASA
ncbi:type I restriction-modification system endonuclease [Lentisphaera profundi]|uniref:Type I restriction-modification system endonuclease n=1 Tax=Lentisphaera profundi TaxID=1658616 RepID=A0ABY7VND2_9BACT|nr:type I restriction-modification system endonuclease [Lentisphaera profundi]WDE95402.1 type I restriction-modification system endonuclease [Lentisphaera profundi]